MQALITEPVIDRSLRFPHCAEMLTHDEIRAELKRQLENGELIAADVARKLSIAPARVTEMRKGERRVQQGEMPALAEMLGMSESRSSMRSIQETAEIPDWGKVAQGVWIEQSDPEAPDRQFVAYDRERGDPGIEDLFAVTPDGTSMNEAWRDPRTKLICRRIPFGSFDFKPGEYVIVQRAAHDLHELTAKRVEIDDEGVYWLHPESNDKRYQEPWRIGKPDIDHHSDREIIVIGKVVRAVVDYERGRQ